MESQDDKRNPLQQLPDDWEQIGLADLLAGRDQLERGHAIHRITVIDTLHAILIALMHAIDADIAWPPIRLRGAALADRHAGGPRLGPVPPRTLGRGPAPQVVQVGDRNPRQPLEARIPEHTTGAFHQLLGGEARHGTMQRIHVGQQGHVRGGKAAGERVPGCAMSVR